MVKLLYSADMTETKKDLLQSISRRLMRIIKKHGRIEELPICLDDGIVVSPTESHTIQAIGESESINVTALAAHFGVTKSAASQTVNKLVRKGYLEKKPSLHSNKELLLELTSLGRRAFDVHEECHSRHLLDIISRLGAFSLGQIATASAFLEVIEDVMDERLTQR